MKPKIATYVVLMVAMSSAGVHAEDWRFSIGPNYRTFGDVEFDAGTFDASAYGTSYNGANYVDGSVVANGLGGVTYTVNDAMQQVAQPGLDIVTFHEVTFAGGDDSTDAAWGLALEACRRVSIRGDWVFGLDLSLTTAALRQESNFGGTVSVSSFDVNPPLWPPAGPGIPADGPLVSANPASPAAPTPVGTLNARVERDLDVDLYTAAVGLSAETAIRGLNVRLGAGPALLLADCEVRTLDWAGWQTGSAVCRHSGSDTTYQVVGGAYASIEAGINLTERVQLGAKARYDYAFDDLDFHGGELDLSGLSAQVLVSIEF